MRFFQKQIYYACYLFYKLIIKIIHPEIKDVWYRNSFFFDYWSFLKSDIDITVILENGTKELISHVSDTHAYFRRFFPIIGELAVYSEPYKVPLLKCINSYELFRDPTLVVRCNISKLSDDLEKIIFLHKFISSNWNILISGSERSKKIAFYSSHIGSCANESFAILFAELANLLDIDADQLKKEYSIILDPINSSDGFPFSNITYALFFNKLCHAVPKQMPLSFQEKMILKKTLLWELWGCFSYQPRVTLEETKLHLQGMLKKTEELTDAAFVLELDELARDLELIDLNY